ncbi:MAG TPA: hypothetical protein VH933_02285 [Aestuariivirgaceae bacterium]
MVQLRLLTDIVGFDLTHVYLMLHVLDKRGEIRDEEELSSAYSQKHSMLRLTLPECHIFLRALREFHGLIEVTTPVLEEAKRAKAKQNGAYSTNGAEHTSDTAAESDEAAADTPLDAILERLNNRITEGPQPADEV